MSALKQPFFTISLDFELFWGVRDVKSISNYGNNILGGRVAIPRLLKMFKSHKIHATWAIVGLLTFENKKEMLSLLPAERPHYSDKNLDPYQHIENIGSSEKEDPYHFGYSLVKQIQETPNMEIASHSHSHFYCLEKNSNNLSYEADIEASLVAFERLGEKPVSMVFCRNQYNQNSLEAISKYGFRTFRGTENGLFYEPKAFKKQNFIMRGGRLTDSYINLTGPNFSTPKFVQDELLNIPSSRFLRHSEYPFLQKVRLLRILSCMTEAAKAGKGFHLWWHPHNFGKNLENNLQFLEKILRHFKFLEEKYNCRSLTMQEVLLENVIK